MLAKIQTNVEYFVLINILLDIFFLNTKNIVKYLLI